MQSKYHYSQFYQLLHGILNFKIMKAKILIFLAFLFWILWSCEKDITVDLPKAEEKLVVEAFIEYNDYAVVFLSKNSSYFDHVDTNSINNSIIKNDEAIVIVESAGIYDTLIPTILDRWPYYGYKGSKIKGQENGIYNLKILWNNNEYFAITTIPALIPIDSLKFNKLSFNDSLGFLDIYWKDPAIMGNYYSITLKDESKQKWFFRPFFGIHILDDKIDNNRTMFYSPLTKGFERNAYYNNNWEQFEDMNFADIIAFRIGDTISVKLATMDKISFLFWSSWYRNLFTAGNPFANPASVKSNIQGAPANGYWIGYGSYISKFYIKDPETIEFIQ